MQQGFVDLRVLECCGLVALRHMGSHQGNRDLGIEWVHPRELLEPAYRGTMVSRRSGALAQLFEQVAVLPGQSLPLLLAPALELLGTGEMEPVEKRTTVQLDRALQRPRSHRRPEFHHISRNDFGIQAEVFDPEKGLLGAEVLT